MRSIAVQVHESRRIAHKCRSGRRIEADHDARDRVAQMQLRGVRRFVYVATLIDLALAGPHAVHCCSCASGIVATARLLGQTSGAALVALSFHLWHDEGPWLALWIGCCFSLVGSIASFL